MELVDSRKSRFIHCRAADQPPTSGAAQTRLPRARYPSPPGLIRTYFERAATNAVLHSSQDAPLPPPLLGRFWAPSCIASPLAARQIVTPSRSMSTVFREAFAADLQCCPVRKMGHIDARSKP